LFNIVKELTGNGKKVILPDNSSDESLTQDFSDFFLQKIAKIREDLDHFDIYIPQYDNSHTFTTFGEVSESTVRSLLKTSKPATCALDPNATSIIKEYDDLFTPIITRIINLSLLSSTFANDWKDAIVIPIIKKSFLGQ